LIWKATLPPTGAGSALAVFLNGFIEPSPSTGAVKQKEYNQAETDSSLIVDLSRAIEELVSGQKKPEELKGIIDEAKTLAIAWKNPYSAKDSKYRRQLFNDTSSETNFLLAALVVVLKRKVQELAEQKGIPTTFEQLEELSNAYLQAHVQLRKLGEAIESGQKSWQVSDKKRSKWQRDFRKSIEYQFGGGLEAEFRKRLPLLALGPYDPSYQPVCLDNIFAGKPVKMRTLEDLFLGIDRKRFGKLLRPSVKTIGPATNLRQKREYHYDWRDVIQIMDGLLKKRPRQKRKKSKPGPAQQIWLNDKDLRERVLRGIEARLKSSPVPVREDIRSAFLKVIHDHLQKIGKR